MTWVVSDDGTMSGDESLTLVIALCVGLFLLGRFYLKLFSIPSLYRNGWQRLGIGLCPPVCLAVVAAAVIGWSDPVVRQSLGYILLFMMVGTVLIMLTLELLPLFGLSYHDDILEARNPAAAVAAGGALVAVTLCFAGSNVGAGPTIWTTIGPAVASVALLFLTWLLLERVGHLSDAVTIDRDLASGVRLASFLMCAGLLLGAAAAGDWRSLENSVTDLGRGAIEVVPFVALSLVAHRFWRPSASAPTGALLSTVLSSGVSVALAGAWVLLAR